MRTQGLAFSSALVRQFRALCSVSRRASSQVVAEECIQVQEHEIQALIHWIPGMGTVYHGGKWGVWREMVVKLVCEGWNRSWLGGGKGHLVCRVGGCILCSTVVPV